MLPSHLKLCEGVGKRLLGSLDMICVLWRLGDIEPGLEKFRGQMLELYLLAWLQNRKRWPPREPAVFSLITRQWGLFSVDQEDLVVF